MQNLHPGFKNREWKSSGISYEPVFDTVFKAQSPDP